MVTFYDLKNQGSSRENAVGNKSGSIRLFELQRYCLFLFKKMIKLIFRAIALLIRMKTILC